jgi:hypothetical protein
MLQSPIKRLEQYTLRHPQEVLVITVQQQADVNEVMIFRGFSSSLSHPTAFDPDIPIISETDEIIRCDRVRSPYSPDNPQYLAQDLSWQQMQDWLTQSGF